MSTLQLEASKLTLNQIKTAYAQAIELYAVHLTMGDVRRYAVRMQQILASMLREVEHPDKLLSPLSQADRDEILKHLPERLASWRARTDKLDNTWGMAGVAFVFALSYGLTDSWSDSLNSAFQWKLAIALPVLIAVVAFAWIYAAARAQNEYFDQHHLVQDPDRITPSLGKTQKRLLNSARPHTSAPLTTQPIKEDKNTEHQGKTLTQDTENALNQAETQHTRALRKIATLSSVSKRMFGDSSEKWLTGYNLENFQNPNSIAALNERLSLEVERSKTAESRALFGKYVFRASLAAAIAVGSVWGLARLFDPSQPFSASVNTHFINGAAVFVGIAFVALVAEAVIKQWHKHYYYNEAHVGLVLDAKIEALPAKSAFTFSNEPEITQQISTQPADMKNKLAFLKQNGIYFTTDANKYVSQSFHSPSNRHHYDPGNSWPVLIQFKKSEPDASTPDKETKGAEKSSRAITAAQFATVTNMAYDIMTSNKPLIELPKPGEGKQGWCNYSPAAADRYDHYGNQKGLYALDIEDLGSIRKAKALGVVLSIMAEHGQLTTENLNALKAKQSHLYSLAAVMDGMNVYKTKKAKDKSPLIAVLIPVLIKNANKLQAFDSVLYKVCSEMFSQHREFPAETNAECWVDVLSKIETAGPGDAQTLFSLINTFQTLDENCKKPEIAKTQSFAGINAERLNFLSKIKAWPSTSALEFAGTFAQPTTSTLSSSAYKDAPRQTSSNTLGLVTKE